MLFMNLKSLLLENYRPSKLRAPNNGNIPQDRWRKYSIRDILTSKNALYSKFGMLIVEYDIYRMH